MASDEDLKLSDLLRYYMRDSHAAKRLLYRRLRCLANYEAANRNLEKARAKNKDVHAVSSILSSSKEGWVEYFNACNPCAGIHAICFTNSKTCQTTVRCNVMIGATGLCKLQQV